MSAPARMPPRKRFRLRVWSRLLPGFIQKRLPKSLGWRAILIIVLPVLIMQLVVTWIFFQLHWETVTARLSEGLAGEIRWVVSAYERDTVPASLARLNADASTNMQVSVRLVPGEKLPDHRKPSLYLVLDRTLDRALRDQLSQPFWFDTTRYPGYLDIRVKVKAGVLRIIAPKERAFATTGYIFIFWVFMATLGLTSVAILFIRNQVRAIERLAQAAEAFGRGEESPNFKPYGATEVRAAAQAFLDMKSRIQRHIEQRTTLLASVSHDLRTPLTRLKLELAMAPKDDPATARMQSDISEMAYMIDEYLAFARGEMAETSESISVKALLQQLADNTGRTGRTPELILPPEDIILSVREMAIGRAISNLISNGFHHASHVRLSLERIRRPSERFDLAAILIDDDGPGIAEDQRDNAFTAFSRLDESRNLNRKGVGLGLAISRDIIRAHGGDLLLETSPLGGLRARIVLPIT